MKTIAQIAEENKVSRQHVYSRVKEAGIDITTLTRKKVGKQTFFDDESVSLIVSALQKSSVKFTHVNNDKKTRIEDLTRQVEALTRSREESERQLAEAKAEIERLKAIEEEQRHVISSQAETIRLKEMREAQQALRLEAAKPDKPGLLARIVKRLSGEKANTPQ